jgi:hypothetical protein
MTAEPPRTTKALQLRSARTSVEFYGKHVGPVSGGWGRRNGYERPTSVLNAVNPWRFT